MEYLGTMFLLYRDGVPAAADFFGINVTPGLPTAGAAGQSGVVSAANPVPYTWSLSLSFDLFSSMNFFKSSAAPSSRIHCS